MSDIPRAGPDAPETLRARDLATGKVRAYWLTRLRSGEWVWRAAGTEHPEGSVFARWMAAEVGR